MDDAGAIPEQHVSAGLFLDIAAQVLVRPPDDGFAVVHQALDDFQRAAGGHHPVGTGFDRRRGIGIDHHGALRVLVAKRRKLFDRATQVKRTGRFQGRHQHALFRGEDFCRLAHEAHPGDNHRAGFVLVAEAGHFQRVGHAAAGFLGQRLDHRVTVVMGNQHRVLRLEFGGDGGTVIGLLLGGQRRGLLGIEVGLDQKAFGNLGHDRWTCRRLCA
ncbi:hypothetical protein D3C79_569270 [compost metagenome]